MFASRQRRVTLNKPALHSYLSPSTPVSAGLVTSRLWTVGGGPPYLPPNGSSTGNCLSKAPAADSDANRATLPKVLPLHWVQGVTHMWHRWRRGKFSQTNSFGSKDRTAPWLGRTHAKGLSALKGGSPWPRRISSPSCRSLGTHRGQRFGLRAHSPVSPLPGSEIRDGEGLGPGSPRAQSAAPGARCQVPGPPLPLRTGGQEPAGRHSWRWSWNSLGETSPVVPAKAWAGCTVAASWAVLEASPLIVFSWCSLPANKWELVVLFRQLGGAEGQNVQFCDFLLSSEFPFPLLSIKGILWGPNKYWWFLPFAWHFPH